MHLREDIALVVEEAEPDARVDKGERRDKLLYPLQLLLNQHVVQKLYREKE